MKYILYVIIILYAFLCMLAATLQMKTAKRKDTAVIMLGGGIFLIASVILHSMTWMYGWVAALIGGAFICVAAFLNGKRSESLHISHHIIRLIITILLIAGLIFLR